MKQVRFSNAMRAVALTGGLFLTASAFGEGTCEGCHRRANHRSDHPS